MKESRNVASEPRMTREEVVRMLTAVSVGKEDTMTLIALAQTFIAGVETGQRLAGMAMKQG